VDRCSEGGRSTTGDVADSTATQGSTGNDPGGPGGQPDTEAGEADTTAFILSAVTGCLVLVAIISCAVYSACTRPKSNTRAPFATGQHPTPQLVTNAAYKYNRDTENVHTTTRNICGEPAAKSRGQQSLESAPEHHDFAGSPVVRDQQGPDSVPEYHDFASNPVVHGRVAPEAPRHYDLQEAKSPRHYDLEEAAKTKAKAARPCDLEEPTANVYTVVPPKALGISFVPGGPAQGAYDLGPPKETTAVYDLGAPGADEVAGAVLGLAIDTGLADDSMSEEEI